MFVPITVDQTDVVDLKCDPDPKNPTRFEIHGLTSRELARVKDRATSFVPKDDGTVEAAFRGNENAYDVIALGLDAIVGYAGSERVSGEDLASAVDSLPLEAIRELSEKIEKLSEIGVPDRKN